MITAIAIDDEPLALDIVREFCSRVGYINLMRTFTKTGAALEYLTTNPVDLLFLDINIPVLSGIDFYKKVAPGTMVIFTTAYSQYAVEGFNLNAIDYLLKPFDFDRFEKAAEKAVDYHTYLNQKDKDRRQYLFLKIDYGIKKIALPDISYIEGQDNYIKIHLNGAHYHLVRMSLKAIQQQLPEKDFIRIHRSYIVPYKKISSLRNKTIYIDDLQIPVSGQYLDEVMKLLS